MFFFFNSCFLFLQKKKKKKNTNSVFFFKDCFFFRKPKTMTRCECTTEKGHRCKKMALEGLTVCATHRDHPCEMRVATPRARSQSRGRTTPRSNPFQTTQPQEEDEMRKQALAANQADLANQQAAKETKEEEAKLAQRLDATNKYLDQQLAKMKTEREEMARTLAAQVEREKEEQKRLEEADKQAEIQRRAREKQEEEIFLKELKQKQKIKEDEELRERNLMRKQVEIRKRQEEAELKLEQDRLDREAKFAEEEQRKVISKKQQLEEIKKGKESRNAMMAENIAKEKKNAEEAAMARQKEEQELQKSIHDTTQAQSKLKELERQKRDAEIALHKHRTAMALQAKQQEENEKQRLLQLEKEDLEHEQEIEKIRKQHEVDLQNRTKQRQIDQEMQSKEAALHNKMRQQRKEKTASIEREAKEQEQKKLMDAERQLQLQEDQSIKSIETDAQKQKATLVTTSSSSAVALQAHKEKSKEYVTPMEFLDLVKEEKSHVHFHTYDVFPPLPYTYARRIFFEGYSKEDVNRYEKQLKEYYGDRFQVIRHTTFTSAIDIDYVVMAPQFNPAERKANEAAYLRFEYSHEKHKGEEEGVRYMRHSDFNKFIEHMPLRVLLDETVFEPEEVKKKWKELFGEWIQYVHFVTIHPDYIVSNLTGSGTNPNAIGTLGFERLLLNVIPILKSNLLPTILRDVWLLDFKDDEANSYAKMMHSKYPHIYRFFSPDISKSLPYVIHQTIANDTNIDILVLPDRSNLKSTYIWYAINTLSSGSRIMTEHEFELFNPNDLQITYELGSSFTKKEITARESELSTEFNTHIQRTSGMYADYHLIDEDDNMLRLNHTYYEKVFKNTKHRGRIMLIEFFKSRMRSLLPQQGQMYRKRNLLRQKLTVFISGFGNFEAAKNEIVSFVSSETASNLTFQQSGYFYNGKADLLIFNAQLSSDNIHKIAGDAHYYVGRPEVTMISNDYIKRFGVPIVVRFDGKFGNDKLKEMKTHLCNMALYEYSTNLQLPVAITQAADYVIVPTEEDIEKVTKRNPLEHVCTEKQFESILALS